MVVSFIWKNGYNDFGTQIRIILVILFDTDLTGFLIIFLCNSKLVFRPWAIIRGSKMKITHNKFMNSFCYSNLCRWITRLLPWAMNLFTPYSHSQAATQIPSKGVLCASKMPFRSFGANVALLKKAPWHAYKCLPHIQAQTQAHAQRKCALATLAPFCRN